ncbi:MAG: putative replicase protein [Gulmivirus nemorisvicinum]|uniref:RNA-directed RNA polymerase n=1 Tax=Leviviridae sp. TaxID=2027243 RepID=A0ABY3SVA1_9VIRU|nr:MAG: putative replicase protein [Leviviridae sp.]
MSKGRAFDFLGFYDAMLKDVASYLPTDHTEWARDRTSLARLDRTRGLGFFTLDLPALDKAFVLSLATGRLKLDGLPGSTGRSSSDLRPRLFWGLWSRIFEKDGSLRVNVDPTVVFFLRSLLAAPKTLKVEADPRYLYQAVRELFHVDACLPEATGNWSTSRDTQLSAGSNDLSGHLGEVCQPDLFRQHDESLTRLLDAVQRSADRMAGIIGEFKPDDYRFRHGPGAVSDLKSGSYKYKFPNWSERLSEVFPYDTYGVTPFGLVEELTDRGIAPTESEGAARLIAVPKTRKAPRLIAAEPLANQWCQQNIRDFLYDRVSRTPLGLSIDFRRQDLSGDMALRASQTGELATIDLSSASDRISCWLVERVFRKNPGLLAALKASRTRYLANTIDRKSPALYKLRKFSTMGSAVTFPVQSLVFLSILLGVGRELHPSASWEDLHRQVRVFGDDLICPVDWVDKVAVVLEALHLKINRAKSFAVGNFRESCGTDAFMGYVVTPARLGLSDLESDTLLLASRVAVSNNFHKKGLWHAAAWLAQTVTHRGRIPVVKIGAGAFGFVTYAGVGIPPGCKVRWSTALQRWEVLSDMAVATTTTVKQDGPACLLQFFTEEPDPYIDWESGVAVGGNVARRRRWVPVTDLGFKPRLSAGVREMA